MTIEEIEREFLYHKAECEALQLTCESWEHAFIAERYFLKLVAIAKEAKEFDKNSRWLDGLTT